MVSLTIPAAPIDASAPPADLAQPASASASSSGASSSSKVSERTKRNLRKEKHRIVAACCGAIVTTLTMTPFDVVKTRLQTQHAAEAMFIPSSHVPPPSQSTSKLPATIVPTPSISSSSSSSTAPASRYYKGKGKGKASVHHPQPGHSMPAPYQHARSLAATNLATCCQKTYFTTNLAEKEAILCKFDPREAAAAAAAASSSSSSSTSTSTTASRFSAASRNIPIAFGNGSGGAGAMVLNASEACLYPTPAAAAEHLPQMTAPSSRHFTGFVDAIAKIVKHEGVGTLWRGVEASLLMSVPSQIIYMVGYETLRSSALEYTPQRFLNTSTNKPSSTYIASTTFLAGSLSRTAVATLLAPLELFRTRLQSTGSNVTFGHVTSSVKDLIRQEGVGSLWRGLGPTLWRDVPFSGVYWAGYEGIRRLLSGGRGMGEVVKDDQASKTFSIAFASGAGSGMIASFLTHPFDVIKTRRQTESSTQKGRGSLAILVDIASKEGMQGLWRGLAPRIAKVAPACGIMIGAYEIGLRWAGEGEDA